MSLPVMIPSPAPRLSRPATRPPSARPGTRRCVDRHALRAAQLRVHLQEHGAQRPAAGTRTTSSAGTATGQHHATSRDPIQLVVVCHVTGETVGFREPLFSPVLFTTYICNILLPLLPALL